jgi:predicted permease
MPHRVMEAGVQLICRLCSLWRNLVHRDRMETDVDDEVRAAFDMLLDENVARGMTPDEARRAATLQLGRVESLKAQVLDAKTGALWAAFLQDVRYGIRLLIRSPVFTLFAIASLALGIGATGSIFLLLDHIVLRTLPVAEPDRLVLASFRTPGRPFNYSLPYPQFAQIRERSTALESVFAINPFGRVTVAVGAQAQMAEGMCVTGDYYRTLRLLPALGRLLMPGDDRPGQAVAVLSHAFWRRGFAGRADVVGAAVALNGIPFTIVGVEPEAFNGVEVGRPYDIAVPMRALDVLNEGSPLWDQAFATWIYVMARLKPGVSLEQAEAESRELFRQASVAGARGEAERQLGRESTLRLEPGAAGANSDLRDTYGSWLRLLLMVFIAVLLLASLNVATLLLARSGARHREIATRLALGAGRERVVRQFLTESLLLGAIAGTFGFALASWGSRVLLRIAVPASERLPVDLTPDYRLVAFTAAVSLLTCVLFGCMPAIRATSPRALVISPLIGSSGRKRLLDRTLVAVQVALSLTLLVAAGLFLRTLGNIWALDTGYDRHNVLMFSVDARLAGRRGQDVPNTYARLLEALRTIPAAQSVTAAAVRPVSDNYYFVSSVRQVGDTSLPEDRRIRVAFNHVAPGFFRTLGISLIAGRDFDERDSLAAPKVVIVSERMARHFNGNPVGQQIRSGGDVLEVVGIVKDIRYANVKDAPREVLYFPMFQVQPARFFTPTFVIRSLGDSTALKRTVGEAVSHIDPGLTVFRMKTLEAQTEDSLSRERLLGTLTGYFGGFAVLLACIGLYGLMSYSVTQRTPEMGLRMALGAPPSAIRWLVVRNATTTVLAGAAVGLVASSAGAGLIRTQLFGIEPHDPIAFAASTLLLLVMAFVAAYLPACRASRIEPIVALRWE